jgi:hypothetical protein
MRRRDGAERLTSQGLQRAAGGGIVGTVAGMLFLGEFSAVVTDAETWLHVG